MTTAEKKIALVDTATMDRIPDNECAFNTWENDQGYMK